MSEGSTVLYPDSKRPCNSCKRRDAIGIFEFGFGVYLCTDCFRARERDRTAHLVNWATRETVDSLIEATHYFAGLQADRHYDKLVVSGVVNGSKGIVCNIIDMKLTLETVFGEVQEQYRYYLVYNRRYLERGADIYERATPGMRGNWQSVHKKVIEASTLDNMVGPYRNHCCIVIVMQDKTVWYINPNKMKTFVFEYDTEDIPRGESEAVGHIPTTEKYSEMISRHDPFIHSVHQLATSNERLL
jgi:hypothetical protein